MIRRKIKCTHTNLLGQGINIYMVSIVNNGICNRCGESVSKEYFCTHEYIMFGQCLFCQMRLPGLVQLRDKCERPPKTNESSKYDVTAPSSDDLAKHCFPVMIDNDGSLSHVVWSE